MARRPARYRLWVMFRTLLPIAAGFATTIALAFASNAATGAGLIARVERHADAARDAAGGQPIGISFLSPRGWLTRHPALTGGENLDDAVRARIAAAIAGTPGVGAVHWRSRGRAVPSGEVATDAQASLHCQVDVAAILEARTIRFSTDSASIEPGSDRVLDEVADALRPCVGSIIAITGHTDANGDQSANLALSQARAAAVRWALIGRGIPADGLRAAGVGAKEPLARLDLLDPANRRIDFSVIAIRPVQPTPVDTPGAG